MPLEDVTLIDLVLKVLGLEHPLLSVMNSSSSVSSSLFVFCADVVVCVLARDEKPKKILIFFCSLSIRVAKSCCVNDV